MLVQWADPRIAAPGRRLLGRMETPALMPRAVAAVPALQPAPRPWYSPETRSTGAAQRSTHTACAAVATGVARLPTLANARLP
jgi:hypothetical protein